MFGSTFIEVAIGLIFVYLLMSLICSAVTEIVESFLKNRATELERGIRELFNQEGGGGFAQLFYNHPLVNGLFRGKYARTSDKPIGLFDYLKPTNLPSYIPARNFAYTVLDLLLHPPAQAEVERDDADAATGAAPAVGAAALPASMEAVRSAIRRDFGQTQTGRALRTLAEQSGEDLDLLRANIKSWFNSAMDRVSGNYKRRTKWIIFALGFALTILLNVNTITIVRSLSTDVTLRSLVVAQAEAYSKREDARKPDLKANRGELEGLGMPLGWPGGIDYIHPLRNERFNIWEHVLLPLLGWLMTAGAVSLGAPFWFDLLNKFMVVRATVKPHEKSLEESSEDRQTGGDRAAITLKTAGSGVPTAGTPAAAGLSGGALAAVPPPSPANEPDFTSAPDPPDNESGVDACDITGGDTLDEELPPAKGGVG